MMKSCVIYLLAIFSCTYIDRDAPIDISRLVGRDYRLFQKTKAWELAKAVEDEDIDKINTIVKNDTSLINQKEPKYGQTLLMLTVRNQQYRSFKSLLENKANVNIYSDFSGSSALIIACEKHNCDPVFVIELLLYGAKVNDIEVGERKEGNSTRFTPLIAASGTGNLEIVKLLIQKGANVNYKNEYNESALSASVMTNEYDVALYLLQHGADYSSPIFFREQESREMYAIDCLREDFFEIDSPLHKKKMKIVEFLRSKGIEYNDSPIPEYIKEKAQKKYPFSWKDYLKKY